jgi:meiotically up-regulated gene 157 (Mug157) protein
MNKYDTTWGQLRRQHGMLWRGNRPGIDDFPSAKTALIIALCVFAMISLIVAVQMHNAATQHEATAEKRANQLGECIQGTARFVTDDNVAIVCRKAEEFGV